MSNQTFHITGQQKQQFQEEGYFVLEKVVPPDHLQMLRNVCDQLVAETDAVDGGSKLRRGGVSRRSDFAAHRCVALKNRENGGFSHHLSQIRREAQECTLTWSFGPRFVAVC